MNIEHSRRGFLHTTAGAAAALSLPSLGAQAADVIPGRAAPKFKFSLAAYSYRKLLTSSDDADAEMQLVDFIDECSAMQLEGTELTSYYMPEEPTEAYLIGLRSRCFRQGLAVSGTAIRNDFGFTEGDERRKQLAHVRRWIDAAAVLHAPMIRIFAGKKKKNVSEEQSHALMVDGMQKSCEYAAKHGIYLALENHGGPTASADGLLKLVHDVDSPWLGVNLDTGNFREGGDPYKQMEAVAPYAVNVQVKVAMKRSNGEVEEMDFERVRDILVAANYRGFVVLEYEEQGDVREECRRYSALLRKLFV